MQSQTHFNFDASSISEREKEEASTVYLMTLMSGFVGIPLPIVNLIGCLLYFLLNRSKSSFVRFHLFQAVVSQICIALMNSAALSWTLSIIFSDAKATDYYWAYLFSVIVFNVFDFIANIIAAIEVRKGKLYSFLFFGLIGKLIYYPNLRK